MTLGTHPPTPSRSSEDAGEPSTIVVLNGPLGIGKSSLAEALSERIDGCVMLGGDALVAANPPSADELDYLHTVLELLVRHHLAAGYRHFVIEHLWPTREGLDDLCRRLRAACPGAGIHCFLLTLPLEENLRRIRRRQEARALDERAYELRTVMKERDALFTTGTGRLGEPFDVSAPLDTLVDTMLRRVCEPRPAPLPEAP